MKIDLDQEFVCLCVCLSVSDLNVRVFMCDRVFVIEIYLLDLHHDHAL